MYGVIFGSTVDYQVADLEFRYNYVSIVKVTVR